MFTKNGNVLFVSLAAIILSSSVVQETSSNTLEKRSILGDYFDFLSDEQQQPAELRNNNGGESRRSERAALDPDVSSLSSFFTFFKI